MQDPAFVARNLLNHMQIEAESRSSEEDRETPASRRSVSDWEKGSGLDQI